MALTNIQQTIWEQALLKGVSERLRFQYAVGKSIQENASSVNFIDIGSVTVDDYSPGSDMDHETLTDSKATLSLSNNKYFSVLVDDVNAASTDSNILAEVARKGAAGLAKAADTAIAVEAATGATIVTGLGTSGTPLEINSGNINTTLAKIARKLRDANADEESLFCIIPPWALEDLQIASPDIFSDNMEIARSGFIGSLYGLKLHVSTNIQNTTSTKYQVIAGDRDSLVFGHSISKIEDLRAQDRFGTIIRGLYKFGVKTVQGSTLALSYWDEVAES